MGYKVGDKIPIQGRGYVKILAFAEGYYMARFKGCVPFLATESRLYGIIKTYEISHEPR